MKKKTRNIQTILFQTYLRNISIVLLVATILFTVTQYRHLRETTDAELQMQNSVVADKIDSNIQQMDAVSLNVAYSMLTKNTFEDWVEAIGISALAEYRLRASLTDELYAYRGADSSIRQINLYSLDENEIAFGIGNYIGAFHAETREQNWFDGVLENQGRRYLTYGTNPQASLATGTYEDRYYFSLFRLYYNDRNIPVGVVEIQKYYDVFFQSTSESSLGYDVNLTVYDENGTILYPLQQEDQDTFDYFTLYQSQSKPDFMTVENTVAGQKEYVSCYTSDYSDLTIIASVNYGDFFRPIFTSIAVMLLLFLIAFFICWISARVVSSRVAAPLNYIYRSLAEINLNRKEKIDLDETGITEIDAVKNSLNNALHFQKEAAQSMMVLKEQEIQAQMLAYQSQMNPHFLYNSLNTIAAMAEEGMDEPIAEMCRDITSILRYISSSKDPQSSLEEELENCDLYLKCIKMRYEDQLTYEFNIPDEMLDMLIPKLCIQMVIENSVKFTTKTTGPWKISVNGHIDEKEWYVDVIDNGPGFRDEVSEYLKSQMDFILANGILPNLEIKGMGILNIFIRLYLTYGITFIFDFYNLPEGGALVRIGGRFDEENK